MEIHAVEIDMRMKTAVSLRLPHDIVIQVEEYAREYGMSKTDAYVHFLQLGLAKRQDDESDRRLERIEDGVNKLLFMMNQDSDQL